MNAVNPQSNSATVKPKDPRNVVTPKARLNYAFLFSPRANNMEGGSGKEEYSATLAFDPGTDLTPLKQAAAAAVNKKWPNGRPKGKQLRNPFRSCSDREGQEGFPSGGVFITAKNTNKPGVVDQAKRKILSDEQIYSGCYVRAALQAFAYDRNGNVGVSFSLRSLQKWEDGDRLDNRSNPDQDFEPLPGADDMFGPDGSKDDDIPF